MKLQLLFLVLCFLIGHNTMAQTIDSVKTRQGQRKSRQAQKELERAQAAAREAKRAAEEAKKAAEDARRIMKPVLYLYPEQTMDINIQVDLLDGKLIHTYPKYDNNWQVTAQIDGTLHDENGQEYYALYWEGDSEYQYDLSTGFVIEGSQTQSFLEEKLHLLGLNAKERNEFIIFWLPILENNPYNLIHFSQEEYREQAQLNIGPQPETLIRIMMVYQPLEQAISIPSQQLEKVERRGFTVVEWGGKLQRKLAE